MNPLPALNSPVTRMPDSAMPHLPASLAVPVSTYSKSNRRATVCTTQRAYPWLLAASTGLAAAFCMMYITKPVIQSARDGIGTVSTTADTGKAAKSSAATRPVILPDQHRLPGEAATESSVGGVASASLPLPASPFEQTNVRIQHILTAEAPGGLLAKIDVDVPVLYQSRNLRWNAAEVADARALLARLNDYQEKSRALRNEGAELLESWNLLVERSIPAGQLRADSPTLPANQQDAADTPRPAGLDTAEAIQIQAAGK